MAWGGSPPAGVWPGRLAPGGPGGRRGGLDNEKGRDARVREGGRAGRLDMARAGARAGAGVGAGRRCAGSRPGLAGPGAGRPPAPLRAAATEAPPRPPSAPAAAEAGAPPPQAQERRAPVKAARPSDWGARRDRMRARLEREGYLGVLAPEDLLSTPGQRGLCAAAFTGMAVVAATGALKVGEAQGLAGALAGAAALGAGWLLADLGTGFYHWGVDNYGSPDTPLVGQQIAAFQGHHTRPWIILHREFSNNTYQICRPALPLLLAYAGLSRAAGLPGEADLLAASFATFVVLSQTLHGWSHGKKSELPPAVLKLQDLGLFISRKAHAEHHMAPFEGNYCIVSGFWNPLLDGKLGKTSIFRKMEGAIFQQWGVTPRCWLTKEELADAVEGWPCI